MTTEELENKIIEEVQAFTEVKVDRDKHIRNDLDIDSLEEIEIVMNLEKTFKINVPDAEAERIKTVSDLIRLISDQLPDAA